MKIIKRAPLSILLGLSLITGCSSNKMLEASSSDESSSTKNSIGEQLNYEIVGIDAGSGSMLQTEKVLADYGIGDKWELIEGSDAAMTASLKKAYTNKEPIIVTGWTPHWKFKKFDLKYLEDPKNGFGGEEAIHTLVRKELIEDDPSAYTFLDRFNWNPADMESVMVQILDGEKPEQAAEEWVENNKEQVTKWVEGIKPVKGKKITISYVAWDTEIASNHVVKYVMEEELGYNVDLRQMQTGPMWAGVANGDSDAMVAAWLPTTDASYYKEFKGKFIDLGPNLKGTKIGLVVPAYMDIDSIEDLK